MEVFDSLLKHVRILVKECRDYFSLAPLSSRDGESDDTRRYLMVIRTFCQPEASEPIDTQRLTSSSAPFVNQGQASPLTPRD